MFGAEWIIFIVFSSYCNYYLKKKCPSSAQSDFMALLARPVAAALPRQVSQYTTADLPKVCCTGTSSGTRIINLMSDFFGAIPSGDTERGDQAQGCEFFLLSGTVRETKDEVFC